jgi:hypothetical protein
MQQHRTKYKIVESTRVADPLGTTTRPPNEKHWRKLYSSPTIRRLSSRMRRASRVTCKRGTRNAYVIVVEKSWCKPRGKWNLRWEYNIKTDVEESVYSASTRFMYIRIESSYALLWARKWIFSSHIMWGTFWLVEPLPASRETLSHGVSWVRLITLTVCTLPVTFIESLPARVERD